MVVERDCCSFKGDIIFNILVVCIHVCEPRHKKFGDARGDVESVLICTQPCSVAQPPTPLPSRPSLLAMNDVLFQHFIMTKSEHSDRPTDEVSFTHQPDHGGGDDNEPDVDDNDAEVHNDQPPDDDLLEGADHDDEQRTGRENSSSSKPPVKADAPGDDCSEITTENAADGAGVAVPKVKEINDEITMTFPQKVRNSFNLVEQSSVSTEAG